MSAEGNRQRQADELLLIESMFPNEFYLIAGLDPQQEYQDPQFQITLPNHNYTLQFTLPPTYPSTALPSVFLGCGSEVSNDIRRILRKKLVQAVESLPKGQESIDILLVIFIDILQSTLASFSDIEKASTSAEPVTGTPAVTRVVLWFHHLLSTQKRHQIVNWSRPLGVSGYSRPGYPGALFIEGEKIAVEDYVTQLKGLKWQAIQVRAEQDIAAGERVLEKGAGVVEVGSLGDIAGCLKEKGGCELEKWFLAAMKIK